MFFLILFPMLHEDVYSEAVLMPHKDQTRHSLSQHCHFVC